MSADLARRAVACPRWRWLADEPADVPALDPLAVAARATRGGRTVAAIADELGLSTATYRRVELGRAVVPATREKVAAWAGVAT